MPGLPPPAKGARLVLVDLCCGGRLARVSDRDRVALGDDVERPDLTKRVLREEQLLRLAEVEADHDVLPTERQPGAESVRTGFRQVV